MRAWLAEMPRNRNTSASGVGSLAARDIKAPITIENTLTLGAGSDHAPMTGVSVLPPFNQLPRRVRGRTEIINQLVRAVSNPKTEHNLAKPPPIWLLHGLGGVGKSTIALAVIRKIKEVGIRGYWVSAIDRQIVQASMWRIARDLAGSESQLLGSPAEPGSVDAVWDVLEGATAPWIIVIDNADNPQMLAADGYRLQAGNGWLRSSHRGFVLVTSRTGYSDAWGPNVIAYRVDPLESGPGGQVLLDVAGVADQG